MDNEMEQQARAVNNFEEMKEVLISIGEKLDDLDIIDNAELEIVQDSMEEMKVAISSNKEEIEELEHSFGDLRTEVLNPK